MLVEVGWAVVDVDIGAAVVVVVLVDVGGGCVTFNGAADVSTGPTEDITPTPA